MAITFHPKQGSILMCDFSNGFMPPEMVKRRPVIVISPVIQARPGLCTVVCLSTTEPDPVMPYHLSLILPEPLPPNWSANNVWVKGDMVYSVSFKRLDFARLGKDRSGKRLYYRGMLSHDTLQAVQRCILHGFGLATLTKYLR